MQLLRSPNDVRAAWLRLGAWIAAIAMIWLGVLPAIGRHPAVRRYIECNEAQGIDPSAKFYTEMPVMPAVLDRIETARRRDAAAFWPNQSARQR